MKEIEIRLLAGTEMRGRCRGCGDPLIWMKTLNGRAMPLNSGAIARRIDGNTAFYMADDAHWASCPDRGKFKGKAK